MKLLGKKALIISITAIVLLPVAAFATYSYVQPPADDAVNAPVKQTAVQTAVEPTPVVSTVEQQPQEAPVASEPVVEQAPVILSTQEYAEKWLNMKEYHAQLCLDRIVARWPHRFTEDVRERNIKALRVYAGVCSSGVDSDMYNEALKAGYDNIANTLIGRDGVNGEFFDSTRAMSRWND